MSETEFQLRRRIVRHALDQWREGFSDADPIELAQMNWLRHFAEGRSYLTSSPYERAFGWDLRLDTFPELPCLRWEFNAATWKNGEAIAAFQLADRDSTIVMEWILDNSGDTKTQLSKGWESHE